MNKVLEYMGKDHDRLDGIFTRFKTLEKDPEVLRPVFHDFKIGLQRHIVWEEEILFSLFEKKTGMYDEGPTAVMREEHRQIKAYLEEIHHRILERPMQDIDQLAQDLTTVLRKHNDKEESILYPWIDESLNEREREEVFERMKSVPPEKYNQCCRGH